MGFKQGTLKTYKKDYFKINDSPRSGGGSEEMPLFEEKCPRSLQQEDH